MVWTYFWNPNAPHCISPFLNESNLVHFCLLCIIILSLFSRRALLSLLLLSKSLCISPSNMAYAKIRFKAFSSKLTLRCKIVSHQICRACLRRSGILLFMLSYPSVVQNFVFLSSSKQVHNSQKFSNNSCCRDGIF